MDKIFKGSALLTALFIMTLVAIAATAMTARVQLDIYRTQLVIQTDKLYLALEGAVFCAMDVVKNARFQKGDEWGRIYKFPAALTNLYPDVKIEGEIFDLQARYNLNNLLDAKNQAVFLRFLNIYIPKQSPQEKRNIVQNISTWISNYQPGKGQEKWIELYTHLKPPYLPAFQPMQSPSELRLVQGVTQPVFQGLLPYITVLPEPTAINLNTAASGILQTLGNGITEAQSKEIIELRGENGIHDLGKIQPILQNLGIPPAQITLESSYFMVHGKAMVDDFTLEIYAVLQRIKDKNGKVSVHLIHESLNTY